MDSQADGRKKQKKDDLRRALIATRAARSLPDRAWAASSNAAHLAVGLAGARIVCAYLPLAREPLAVGLLDTLVGSGSTVLVPVVAVDSPLDWCRYPSPTLSGPFGIAEPTGPRLGPASVLRADFVLVPALAVDPAGHRLGRGGGHYDRSLALLGDAGADGGTADLIAVLFDDELLEEVPAETHDRLVTAAVTPTRGISHFRS